MVNFWDSNVWGTINLIGILLLSLLAANFLKKSIPFLKYSLIPTSVLGGAVLLLFSMLYKAIFGVHFLETAFFNYAGVDIAEILTYHCLALGFIATSFRSKGNTLGKERLVEIFNTGVTTVSSYLMQAVLGLGITILLAKMIPGFFAAAGVLLPFGYGQGTGQALNYGSIYETSYGFVGGKSFGLTIAAFGFISAAIGGVVHLNILKKKGRYTRVEQVAEIYKAEDIQKPDEIPMNGSIDKLTIQMGIVCSAYLMTNLLITVLSAFLPSLKSILYGFNFLLGVISATVINAVLTFLKKKRVVNKEYVNPFLMNRISAFFFDLMIVAGIAAIRIETIREYWLILIVLGVVGMVSTYFYNLFVAKKLFPNYKDEQFLVMYGMLTGTASTGIVLLREKDPELKSPASENLVYQNFPAMVFGFPIMLLAALAPTKPELTWVILLGFFAVMNLILFRSKLFRKKSK